MFRRLGFPGSSSDKEPICQCRRHKRHGFNPWVRKIPWRRKWQLTPVLLPGESHGQRSLAATVHRIAQSWTRLHMHSEGSMTSNRLNTKMDNRRIMVKMLRAKDKEEIVKAAREK